MLLRSKVLNALQMRLVHFRRLSLQHSKGGVLNLNVGGFEFSLFPDDIRKHPGCYFETLLTDGLQVEDTVSLSQDGAIFRYVQAFLVSNSLPKNSETGFVALDEATLRAVANQAKSLMLPQLSAECEQGLEELRSIGDIGSIDKEWEEQHLRMEAPNAPAVQALRQLWRPLHLSGALDKSQFSKTLFKKSSFENVDLDQLINTANIIRLPTAPMTPQVFEIGAFLLDERALEEVMQSIQLAPLYSDRFVKLRPRKLQVLCEGSSQHIISSHSGSGVEGETVVGTVEVVLDSSFTGGELQMQCDGQVTDLQMSPYEWVAVHADASCCVSPVTSGARVSLLFDVLSNDGASNRLTDFSAFPDFLDLLHRKYAVDTYVVYELLPGVSFHSPQANKLVRIAKELAPENTSTNSFQIDGRLCNEEMVSKLIAPAVQDLEKGLNREIIVRANRLEIQLPGASFTRTVDDHPISTGFMGALVVVLGGKYQGWYQGGANRFHRDGKHLSIYALDDAYVLPANTVHEMTEITGGARVALVCDIFDKHMVKAQALAQDPLSLVSSVTEGNDDDSSDTDSDSDGKSVSNRFDRCKRDICYDSDCDCRYSSDEYDTDGYDSDNCNADTTTASNPVLITRFAATLLVRDAILSSLASAFDSHDAVVITLQDVYPSDVPVDITIWQGGDRALYEILTTTTHSTTITADATDNAAITSAVYDVQLVKVTLHSEYDAKNSKYVLSEGTATTTDMDNDLSALLLVPTKITDAHRVPFEKHEYEVSALRVTKRM